MEQDEHKFVKKKCLTSPAVSVKIARVRKMNEFLRQSLLYDFYGELLNSHQKEVYEQFLLEDLSLSEIAQEAGISRQGVHDLVRRCRGTLEGYEEKLHLVERFLTMKEQIAEIKNVLELYEQGVYTIKEMTEKIRQLSDLMIEEL